MVLYKPDCDSNDCEQPNEKATPSILAIEVWLVRLHACGVAGLLIEYHTVHHVRATVALGLALAMLLAGWLAESKDLFVHQQLYASRSSTCDINNTCMCLGQQASTRAKGVWSCVTLFIAYSFSCDSFDCVLCKNSQFAIKRILHSKPDLYYKPI